ncbi:hypothetical protein BYT27DRAFT_7215054 [Phlegmacium glaucopus]|nr:hypothetical protein BYT27DRAFT_7215054 [Phlegmacium glaucopus]
MLHPSIKKITISPENWPEYRVGDETAVLLQHKWASLNESPHFRSALRRFDEGLEEPLHQFAELWHDDKATDGPEFQSAQCFLASLELLSKRKFHHQGNNIAPDLTVVGFLDEDTTIPKNSDGQSPLATLELKAVGIVEKDHSPDYFQAPTTTNNKDTFMTGQIRHLRSLVRF